MQLLYGFNRFIEKWMPFVTPCSALLGVLFSSWLQPYAFLVPWIFAFMTFAGGLGSNFKDMGKVLQHPAPLVAIMLILHVWMPLVAWGAGSLFFQQDMYTVTGIVLAFIIPTGIISFMWVSIYQGNVALTLSLILIDTFLSPFIVPASLHYLVGANVNIDVWGMMGGLTWMVVLPSVIAMALNQKTGGRVKTTLGPKLAPFSKLGLILVVAMNTSVVAPYFRNIDLHFVAIALTVLFVAASGYIWGWLAGRLLKGDTGVIIAMTFNSGMRNISAGAVLAATYFSAPVVLPVIVGTLFQQTLASTYAYLLGRTYGRDAKAKESLTPLSGLQSNKAAG